ncbi:hypothetical protein NDU88_001298 [Pleurodeles waltl]|uniref:BEN domain-containing protein n=3 Tax=Pleurodeles waltl TaxID=8319 RepID=A0AAV7UUY0_PLEWA|nr:hypothetical protein NDU88_001298 [Pleurodeles waltl]
MSELKQNSKDVRAGSNVTFTLPVRLVTQQGETLLSGQRDYKGTLLFHTHGLMPCVEKQQALQGFIAEKKGLPGSDILDLLLELTQDIIPLKPCAVGVMTPAIASKTTEENVGHPCKKIKICDTPHHFRDSGVSEFLESIAPPGLHSTWSLPPVSVKSEQAGAPRLDSSLDENSFQSTSVEFETIDDTEDESKGEEGSEKNNPFAVLENLIKENQSLKKENARLKRRLLAAQNAAPFRLLSRETRDSAAHYLRLVLEHLEGTNATAPSPSAFDVINQISVPHATNVQVPLVLHPKDPERYSHILVDSFKVRDSISKARAAKDHGITLLNQVIDLVFSTAELAQSSGLGMRGNRKDDALDPVRIQACREFVRSICNENNWEEPTEAGFRKRFSNKVSNARREIRLRAQLSPEEHLNE